MGLFSILMGMGKPHSLGWAGIVLAIFGVSIVLTKGDLKLVHGLWTNEPGLLWVLGATIAWAMYSVIYQKRSTQIPSDVYLFSVCFSSLILLAPLVIWESGEIVAETVGLKEWLIIIYLGVIPSFFAYRGYAVVQKELGILAAGTILFITPLANSFLANLLLDEGLNWFHIVGGAAILFGTALIVKFPAKR